jgi:hypothetical protein
VREHAGRGALVILTFKQFGTGRKYKASKLGRCLAVVYQISLGFKQLARLLHVAILSAAPLDIGYRIALLCLPSPPSSE